MTDKAEGIERLCAEHGHDPARILFVANDVNDLPAIRRVGYAVAVADSHPAVRDAAWLALQSKGGAGVAREIVESVVGFTAPFEGQALDR